MNEVYLSLGSNEGDRMAWLEKAMALLSEKCGAIMKHSSVYETAAWGITDQQSFLNMAVLITTTQSPLELLTSIHDIEQTLGRQRTIKWGPRTLDIDILLFNHDTLDTPELKIPHPFLPERRFTLVPLAEIASSYIHPALFKTIQQLLDDCADKLDVVKVGGN